MAKKVVDFIKSLIVKAGGNLEEEKIKAALAAFNVDAELHDDVATQIEHGLISIANAKNNHPEIKNHYFASAYNGLDSELDALMQEEKLSEDIVTEIKSEKSSTKRAALLVKKIKELESVKQSAGKGKTEELNNQIAALNDELRKQKDSIGGIKTEYEKKLREKDKGFAMRNILSGYQTIHDKLDPETKSIIINAIIEKNLRTNNLVLDIDENGNLDLKTKDGGNVFSKDHQPLTPKMFFDKMMAEESLLVVTDNKQQQQNTNGNNNQQNGQQRQHYNNNGQSYNNNRQHSNNNGNNGSANNGNRGSSVLQDLIKRSQNDLNNSDNAQVF